MNNIIVSACRQTSSVLSRGLVLASSSAALIKGHISSLGWGASPSLQASLGQTSVNPGVINAAINDPATIVEATTAAASSAANGIFGSSFIPPVFSYLPTDPAFLAMNGAVAGTAKASAGAASIAGGIALPLAIGGAYGLFLIKQIRKVREEQRLLSHTPETIYELAGLHDEMLQLTEGSGRQESKMNSWWQMKGARYVLLLASLFFAGKQIHAYFGPDEPVDENALEKLIDFFVEPTTEKFGDKRDLYEFSISHEGYSKKIIGEKEEYRTLHGIQTIKAYFLKNRIEQKPGEFSPHEATPYWITFHSEYSANRAKSESNMYRLGAHREQDNIYAKAVCLIERKYNETEIEQVVSPGNGYPPYLINIFDVSAGKYGFFRCKGDTHYPDSELEFSCDHEQEINSYYYSRFVQFPQENVGGAESYYFRERQNSITKVDELAQGIL